MEDMAIVGRCGLYCGACGVYRAYKDGGGYLEYVVESWKIPEEKLRCEGCQALTPDCWGTGCEIMDCLEENGYAYCYECESFKGRSCERYEGVASRYLGRGQDIREALLRVQAGEAEEWLEEQDRRWRCPSCGRPVSWHAHRCFGCGARLRSSSG